MKRIIVLKKIQYVGCLLCISMMACNEFNDTIDNGVSTSAAPLLEADEAPAAKLAGNEFNDTIDNGASTSAAPLLEADEALAAKLAGIENRLDLNRSNFSIPKLTESTDILENEPNLSRFISNIPFVSSKISQTKISDFGNEDVMINPDNEKGEPAIMVFKDSGLFSVDNRIIPTPRPYQEKRSLAADAEDQAIIRDVEKRMQSLGIESKSQYEIVLGRVVATELRKETGKISKREYERVARVYRKFNGIRVNNKIVFSYDVSLNLRKVKGRWNQINLKKSRITTSDSADTLRKKVVDGLVALDVNPDFKNKIHVFPVYKIEKDRDGDFVMNLKMAAKVPIESGVEGQPASAILDINI